MTAGPDSLGGTRCTSTPGTRHPRWSFSPPQLGHLRGRRRSPDMPVLPSAMPRPSRTFHTGAGTRDEPWPGEAEGNHGEIQQRRRSWPAPTANLDAAMSAGGEAPPSRRATESGATACSADHASCATGVVPYRGPVPTVAPPPRNHRPGALSNTLCACAVRGALPPEWSASADYRSAVRPEGGARAGWPRRTGESGPPASPVALMSRPSRPARAADRPPPAAPAVCPH
jgi:hypothetical protein